MYFFNTLCAEGKVFIDRFRRFSRQGLGHRRSTLDPNVIVKKSIYDIALKIFHEPNLWHVIV